jgi:hypothetical protein
MSTTAPEITYLDPDLEAAMRAALDNAKPCQVVVNGIRCDQIADWVLHVGCGCRKVHCCNGHRPVLTTARGTIKLLCHVGVAGCRKCPKCAAVACAGRDQWEPIQ